MLSVYVWNLLVHLTEKFRVELISNNTRSKCSQDVQDVAHLSVAGLHFFFFFGFIVRQLLCYWSSKLPWLSLCIGDIIYLSVPLSSLTDLVWFEVHFHPVDPSLRMEGWRALTGQVGHALIPVTKGGKGTRGRSSSVKEISQIKSPVPM